MNTTELFIVLAAVGVGVLVLVMLAPLKKGILKRKKKRFDANEVGIEALRATNVQLITAPPIRMFDHDVVWVRIGDINDRLVDIVAAACRRAADNKKTLQVTINTDGGDVIIARSVRGILQHFIYCGHDLRMIVTGKCYSAGMVVLMSVEPSQRYAVSGSEFMLHATKRTANNGRDKRTAAFDNEMADVVASNSRVDRSSLDAHFKSGRDCLLSANEALQLGIIGGII